MSHLNEYTREIKIEIDNKPTGLVKSDLDKTGFVGLGFEFYSTR